MQTPVGDENDWVVDVVLRALGNEDAQDRVVEKVSQAVRNSDTGRQPRPTSSYDMAPPDGSIGVSLWIRADSAGEAVDEAIRIVTELATTVTARRHPVWDVRALPGTAVYTRAEAPDDDSRRRIYSRLVPRPGSRR